MKIAYFIEELAVYRREIEAPDGLAPAALDAWLEENMGEDWTTKGSPTLDFQEVRTQEFYRDNADA